MPRLECVPQGMNDELQAQLLDQEKEVERLKAALEAAAERGLSQPQSPARCAGRGGGEGSCTGQGCRQAAQVVITRQSSREAQR